MLMTMMITLNELKGGLLSTLTNVYIKNMYNYVFGFVLVH